MFYYWLLRYQFGQKTYTKKAVLNWNKKFLVFVFRIKQDFLRLKLTSDEDNNFKLYSLSITSLKMFFNVIRLYLKKGFVAYSTTLLLSKKK